MRFVIVRVRGKSSLTRSLIIHFRTSLALKLLSRFFRCHALRIRFEVKRVVSTLLVRSSSEPLQSIQQVVGTMIIIIHDCLIFTMMLVRNTKRVWLLSGSLTGFQLSWRSWSELFSNFSSVFQGLCGSETFCLICFAFLRVLKLLLPSQKLFSLRGESKTLVKSQLKLWLSSRKCAEYIAKLGRSVLSDKSSL